MQSSSSLTTYIGYITGPRGDQPVGVRVVEPPPGTRQHQRGSLYAVVEVTGDHPDRAAILERLLSEVQRVYYSAKGSQSQVMVEAVQQTQQLLREINAHTPHYPLQVGMTCAALLGNKLLVASSGPAFALMRVTERVHMFPSEPAMNVAGYGNVPIETHRQDVEAGDAFFLGGGGWLRRVQTRTLASIVAFTNADNCTDAADELYDQAGQMQVPGLLIVLGAGGNFEPPRTGGYGGGYSGGGGGYPSAPSGGQGGGQPPRPAPRRPRFGGGGLPTALNTAPPARMPPATPMSSSSTYSPSSSSSSSTSSSLSSAPPTANRTPSASTPSHAPTPPTNSPPRTARPEWEQPPTEVMPPRTMSRTTPQTMPQTMPHTMASDEPPATPPASPPSLASTLAANASRLEPPLPTNFSNLSVDEPIVETPLRQTRNFETPADEIPASATPAYEETNYLDQIDRLDAADERALSEPPVAEEPRRRYPVSPLEEESFGGDLPVEPGDEFDPIFPASADEHVERPPRRPSWLEQWQAQATQRMGQARSLFGRMLPPRRMPETSTEWEELPDERFVAAEKPKRPRFNEMAANLEAAAVQEAPARPSVPLPLAADEEDEGPAEATVPLPAPELEMSPFAPPAPTRGARARLFLLVALIVVILVPVVVFAVNYGQGNSRRIEAQQLTERAEVVLLGAQSSLDQGDKVTARERLTEAQDYLAQAIELDGTNEYRSQLIAMIELELQEVLQITPLYGLTEPLITFPPDARPRHVLVMNEDIFVVDEGRQALLQYRLDPSSGTVADQMGQVILSQGDNIGGMTVGTLADLAWLPLIPGVEDRPSLVITDRNNNVFRYDQRVEGATLMSLVDRNTWGSIGQVQTYNGRVYLADEARGLILRYNPGAPDQPGESWFSPEVQANLAGLISMEIDGDIWLLFSNGAIMRYRERVQLPFSPENSIGLAEEPSDMYVTRQESPYIYLVDAGQDRILVYDKAGAYIGQLTAPEDDMLRGLSGIYVDEVGGTMYILTQTGLFAHPVLP